MEEVDEFLDVLATMTKDEERIPHFKSILHRLTPIDLKWIVRLIDHDLKINIGAKFVLEALHPNAFDAFKNTNNLKSVVEKVMKQPAPAAAPTATAAASSSKPAMAKQLSTGISLFHPIKPMLAKPCKSFDEIWNRCKNGMFAEIKYDGERVQIHKHGEEYQYFSRNLKQVTEHKVADLKEFIPQAMVAEDIILDAEILLCEAATNKPLPFGSLGVHKKKGYADATICIFVFDILYVDGEDLMKVAYSERRRRLVKLVKEIPGHVRLAEAFEIKTEDDLSPLWNRVIREGLEGLMIKAADGEYHPAARHWLKLKKDYLGGMADTADLIVLGANLGTGQKGGLRSSFLMGVYDPATKRFKTVCKCANGFDDATLAKLQTDIPMLKCTPDTVPDWLDVDRSLAPAFVVPNPKNSPVWAIEGAQFTRSERHTAGGFSIRFPRIQRFRDDKDWTTATSLPELIDLAQTSLATATGAGADDDDDDDDAPKAKKAAAKKAAPASPAKSPKKAAAQPVASKSL
jgi:DNA ligase 3